MRTPTEKTLSLEAMTKTKMSSQKYDVYLSEEELKEFKEIFLLVDKDASGDIDKDEILQLMTVLGLDANIKEVDKMMKEMVFKTDGKIDFKRFVEVMIRKKKEMIYTPKEVKNAFKVFEQEGDKKSTIKSSVLLKALMTYGRNPMDLKEAENLISIVDPEETGIIHFVDFVNKVSN